MVEIAVNIMSDEQLDNWIQKYQGHRVYLNRASVTCLCSFCMDFVFEGVVIDESTTPGIKKIVRKGRSLSSHPFVLN